MKDSAKTQSAPKKKKATAGKTRRNVWLLVATTLLVVLSVWLFMPPQEKINQGLDIQGGLSVVLTASTTDGSDITDEDMETSRDIIASRVDALGANEASVQIQSGNQILVQIPGLSDTEEALNTIGKTGVLYFARLDSFTDDDVVTEIENGTYLQGGYVTDDMGNQFATGESTSTLQVEDGTYDVLVSGDNITDVYVDKESDVSQYYAVNIRLDSEGTAAFAEATKDLVADNGQIVIILDGYVQSAPAVQAEITTGEVQITGNYTQSEAEALETVLESGSLPVSFEYSQSQTVGPTLGQGVLSTGVLVALIGLLLVMLYLLFFYGGLGFLTAGAMAVFAVMYLGLLALLSHFNLFSLSMAGLAGIVLTIGMAADSSILTLERFREEIRMGRSVKAASITGVKHGIMTSIDADLVTMVSALTLFFLASASVKGFGLTLFLGICCDIIMMLLFKAPIIRLLAPISIAKHPGFWGIKDCQEAVPYCADPESVPADMKVKGRFVKRDFNFLQFRKIFLAVAACVVVALLIITPIRGMKFGIEFSGGTSITIYGTDGISENDLRDALVEAGGESDATIQTTTSSQGESGYLIRMSITDAGEAATVATNLADNYGWDTDSYQVDTISPSWGNSVIQSSIIAFLVSLVLIILYISARFRDAKMGVVAVVTLCHDLLIVLGVYVLIGREISPNTIAALLTILGYSLYDTVVVFHRISENMQDEDVKCTFMTMANHSINEVIIRSINTSVTSLIPVVAMLLFGGETLRDFALTMTVGLIVGCYSSIVIATPLYSIWRSHETRFQRLTKRFGDQIVPFYLGKLPASVTRVSKAAKAEAPVAAVAAEAPVAVAADGGEAVVEAPVAVAAEPKPAAPKRDKYGRPASNHNYKRKKKTEE